MDLERSSFNDCEAAQKFGYLMAVVCTTLAVYSIYKREEIWQVFSWIVAGMLIISTTIIAPKWLIPLNAAWMKLGDLMGKIVSPLVLGVIFFMLITPVALIGRLFDRDELRLNKANVNSYWIDRVPPGPAGESFRNQF